MAEESIKVRSTKSGKRFVKNIKAEMKALSKAEEKEDWNAVDEIRESLGDCLDLKVKKQLEILLSYGGPSSKILYDIDSQEASYWFQDWFKAWSRATLTSKESEVLSEYVQKAYSGLIEECESERMY